MEHLRTPLSNLSNEELLLRVFLARAECSDLEVELAVRLEQLIDETRENGTTEAAWE